jgi:hypothetical protein
MENPQPDGYYDLGGQPFMTEAPIGGIRVRGFLT